MPPLDTQLAARLHHHVEATNTSFGRLDTTTAAGCCHLRRAQANKNFNKRMQGSINRGKQVMKHTCGSESIPKKRVKMMAFGKVVQSWASRKFMTGCVILFPIAITFYITWGFIYFMDGFFSPIYEHLGINIFGLGFVTFLTFIFVAGVFLSSWLGASLLGIGEWFIERMPFVRHIYNASKQISSAISPDNNAKAFKEVAIIRHPRIGEYALGFITSSVVLQSYSGDEELCCVYVPNNHMYLGDIFLISAKDIIRPNISVREGIEIIISVGMSMPKIISTGDKSTIELERSIRIGRT